METILDCGHTESQHSEITRGYGTDDQGKKHCYDCCLSQDIDSLKESGKLTAYVSMDGKTVQTWPDSVIAKIVGSHIVDFGYCRNQISFNAVMTDGTKLVGRGPGTGMYCRVRIVKSFS